MLASLDQGDFHREIGDSFVRQVHSLHFQYASHSTIQVSVAAAQCREVRNR